MIRKLNPTLYKDLAVQVRILRDPVRTMFDGVLGRNRNEMTRLKIRSTRVKSPIGFRSSTPEVIKLVRCLLRLLAVSMLGVDQFFF